MLPNEDPPRSLFAFLGLPPSSSPPRLSGLMNVYCITPRRHGMDAWWITLRNTTVFYLFQSRSLRMGYLDAILKPSIQREIPLVMIDIEHFKHHLMCSSPLSGIGMNPWPSSNISLLSCSNTLRRASTNRTPRTRWTGTTSSSPSGTRPVSDSVSQSVSRGFNIRRR